MLNERDLSDMMRRERDGALAAHADILRQRAAMVAENMALMADLEAAEGVCKHLREQASNELACIPERTSACKDSPWFYFGHMRSAIAGIERTAADALEAWGKRKAGQAPVPPREHPPDGAAHCAVCKHGAIPYGDLPCSNCTYGHPSRWAPKPPEVPKCPKCGSILEPPKESEDGE